MLTYILLYTILLYRVSRIVVFVKRNLYWFIKGFLIGRPLPSVASLITSLPSPFSSPALLVPNESCYDAN